MALGDAQRIYQLIIDAGGSKAGAEMFKRAAEQIEASSRVAAAQTQKLTDSVAASDKEWARMQGRLDPIGAAQRRMAAEIAVVERRFAAQRITTDEAGAALQRITQRYEAAVERARMFGQTAAGGTASYRSFGSVVQQAGFQVGDFAVQVASGQGVLRPFIQQGTQLISMFGPWGAVVGAAGAVVGALATSLMGASDAADEAEDSVKLYADALEAAEKITDALKGSTDRNIESLQSERRYRIELTEAEIAATEAKIALVRASVAAEAVQQSPDDIGRALDNVENVVRSKTAELQKLLDGYDVIENGVKTRVYGLKERLAELKFGPEDMDPFARMGSDNTSGGGGGSTITKTLGDITAAMEEENSVLALSKTRREEAAIIDRRLAEIGKDRTTATKEELAAITELAKAQVALNEANKKSEQSQRQSVENARANAAVLAGLKKQYDDLTKAPLQVRAENLFKLPTPADLAAAEELLKKFDEFKNQQAADKAFNQEINQIIAEGTRAVEQRQKWQIDSLQAQESQIALLRQELALRGANDNERDAALARLKAEQEIHERFGTTLDENARRYIENAEAIVEMNQQLQKQRAVAAVLPQFFDQAFDRIGSAITQAMATGEIAMVNLLDVGRSIVSELIQEFIKLAAINPLKNWISGSDALPTFTSVVSNLMGGLFNTGGLGSAGAPMNMTGSSWNFRDGGVMGSAGPVPLRRYAAGGVADRPQLAMFGEGSVPEAYVPLADGRSIPVTLRLPEGGASGGTVVNNINVEVNAAGGTESQNRDLGEQTAGAIDRMLDERIDRRLAHHRRTGNMFAPGRGF